MNVPEDTEFVVIDHWEKSLYQDALSWVDAKRRVVFISEKEQPSEDPRVKIIHLESPLQRESVIKKIAWSAVFRKMVIFGETFFKDELERAHLGAHLILSEAADWGVIPMKNGLANQSSYRRGMDLKGAFTKVPALIVGAGPSLEKNGHLIREFEKKGLIFAGGSALNVIDVEPHFAASIDAAAPHDQFKQHPFPHVPFCYQSRMNRENFSLIQGEKILFPDSSLEPLNWIYGEELWDGGWTVGNFLTAVALHLGCDPIIFIGMDLCYTKDRKYAKIDAEIPDGLIQVGDVWTQKDWLMAAKWTEEKKGPFLNATEGGILNIPRIQFEELLLKLPDLKNLKRKVAEIIQNLPLNLPSDRWKEWEASLERCRQNLDEDEIVYQKLLAPLWQIWRPIFEREVEVDPSQRLDLHQMIFFQQVIEEHGAIVLSER